jgi:hypothetical protein
MGIRPITHGDIHTSFISGVLPYSVSDVKITSKFGYSKLTCKVFGKDEYCVVVKDKVAEMAHINIWYEEGAHLRDIIASICHKANNPEGNKQ